MGIHGVDADERLAKSTQKALRELVIAADRILSF